MILSSNEKPNEPLNVLEVQNFIKHGRTMKVSKHQKVLQIYDYATNIGYILIKQSNDPKIQNLGKQLISIGAEAIDKYRVKKNKQMIKNIINRLDKLYINETKFDLLEGLNILFLGLSELIIHTGTKLYSNKLRDITLQLIRMLDPEGVMENAYSIANVKYDNWLL